MKSLSDGILQDALKNTSEGLLIAARRGSSWRTVFCNPAFADLARLEMAEVAGRALRDVLEGAGLGEEWVSVRETLSASESLHHVIYPGGRNAPAPPLLLRLVPLRAETEGNAADHYACYLRLREGDGEAADGPPRPADAMLAGERRDSATGLAPRQFFDGVLTHDWGLAQREGQRLSLLVFRIDAFRSYLDTFGRHATESMLRRVARCITKRLRRASDIASRLEEDCIVALVHGGDEAAVRGFADSIAAEVKSLKIHHPHSPVGRYLTVSTTVSLALPEPGDSVSDFLLRALSAGED